MMPIWCKAKVHLYLESVHLFALNQREYTGRDMKKMFCYKTERCGVIYEKWVLCVRLKLSHIKWIQNNEPLWM